MRRTTNAASELTHFWLRARHGCLEDKALNVPEKLATGSGNSDMDLIAIRSGMQRERLHSGWTVRLRVILKMKYEHNFNPNSQYVGKRLAINMALLNESGVNPAGIAGATFSILRQEDCTVEADAFGTDDFDCFFATHTIDSDVLGQLASTITHHRIYWITVPPLLADLLPWCAAHRHLTELRQLLVGDLLSLLLDFCHLTVQLLAL